MSLLVLLAFGIVSISFSYYVDTTPITEGGSVLMNVTSSRLSDDPAAAGSKVGLAETGANSDLANTGAKVHLAETGYYPKTQGKFYFAMPYTWTSNTTSTQLCIVSSAEDYAQPKVTLSNISGTDLYYGSSSWYSNSYGTDYENKKLIISNSSGWGDFSYPNASLSHSTAVYDNGNGYNNTSYYYTIYYASTEATGISVTQGYNSDRGNAVNRTQKAIVYTDGSKSETGGKIVSTYKTLSNDNTATSGTFDTSSQSGDEYYAVPALTTLVATPSAGYKFVGWYTDPSGSALSTDASAGITVDGTTLTYHVITQDYTIYAKFETTPDIDIPEGSKALTLDVNGSTTVTPTLTNAGGASVTYSPMSSEYFTITTSGNVATVTALKPTTSAQTVTASFTLDGETYSDTFTVSVSNPACTTDALTVYTDQTSGVSGAVTPDQTYYSISYATADSSIFTVNSSTGLITPVAVGTANLNITVTYQNGGYSKSFTRSITVANRPVYLCGFKDDHNWDQGDANLMIYNASTGLYEIERYIYGYTTTYGSGSTSDSDTGFKVIDSSGDTVLYYGNNGTITSSSTSLTLNSTDGTYNVRLTTKNCSVSKAYYKFTYNYTTHVITAYYPSIVTFNMQSHGSAVSAQVIKYGEKATQPTPAPTATGYTFGGWYKETGCTNAWDFSTDTVTADTPLYAKWTPITYTVTLDANGGTIDGSDTKTISHTYGTATDISGYAPATRTGYTYDCWYTGSSGGTKKTSIGATDISANTIYYVHWTAKTSALTFDGNGATSFTASTGLTATYDSPLPYPSGASAVNIPTKTGYTFLGFFDNTTGGTKYYNADGTRNTDHNSGNWDKDTTDGTPLYARWQINSYTVTYSAKYRDQSESWSTTLGAAALTGAGTYTYGTSVTLTAGAVAGYTLNGIYDSTGTQKSSTDSYTFTLSDADVTYYAYYTRDLTVSLSVTATDEDESSNPTSMATLAFSATGDHGTSSSYTYTYTYLYSSTEIAANAYTGTPTELTGSDLTAFKPPRLGYYKFMVTATDSVGNTATAYVIKHVVKYNQKYAVTVNAGNGSVYGVITLKQYDYVEDPSNPEITTLTNEVLGGSTLKIIVDRAASSKSNYYISSLTVTMGGTQIASWSNLNGDISEYELTDNVTGEIVVNCTVYAKPQVTITADANSTHSFTYKRDTASTTVSAAGSYYVDYNSDISYTVTPSADYYVSALTSSPAGVVNALATPSNTAVTGTMSGVTADTTLTATITEKPVITIASNANASAYSFSYTYGGSSRSASAAGSYHIDYGTNISLTVTAASNYKASNITSSVGAVTVTTASDKTTVTGTMTGVTASTTLTTTIGSNNGVTVSLAEGSSGGSLTVAGGEANFGTSYPQQYNTAFNVVVTPPSGYYVSNVAITNGTYDTLAAYNSGAYTISNVKVFDDDVAITVTYTANPIVSIVQPVYGSIYVTSGSGDDIKYYMNGDSAEYKTVLTVHTYANSDASMSASAKFYQIASVDATVGESTTHLVTDAASSPSAPTHTITADTTFSADITYGLANDNLPSVAKNYRRVLVTDNKKWSGDYGVTNSLYVHYSNSNTDYTVASDPDTLTNCIRMSYLYNEGYQDAPVLYADIPSSFRYVFFFKGDTDPDAETGDIISHFVDVNQYTGDSAELNDDYLKPLYYTAYGDVTSVNTNAFSTNSSASSNPYSLNSTWQCSYADLRTVGSAGVSGDRQQATTSINNPAVFSYQFDSTDDLLSFSYDVVGSPCTVTFKNGVLSITPTSNARDYSLVTITSDISGVSKYYLIRINTFEFKEFSGLQRLYNNSTTASLTFRTIAKAGIGTLAYVYSYSYNNVVAFTEMTTSDVTTNDSYRFDGDDTIYTLKEVSAAYGSGEGKYLFSGIHYFRITVSNGTTSDSKDVKAVFGLNSSSGGDVIYFQNDTLFNLTDYRVMAAYTVGFETKWVTMQQVGNSSDLFRGTVPKNAESVKFYLMYADVSPNYGEGDLIGSSSVVDGSPIFYYTCSSDIDIQAGMVYKVNTITDVWLGGSYTAFMN